MTTVSYAIVGMAFLAACPASAAAQTLQNFDTPGAGTPYVLGNHIVAPPPPAVGAEILAGGPAGDGRFLRLAFAAPVLCGNPPAPRCTQNSIAFDRSQAGEHDAIVVDFDFRMTPRSGFRADGIGFALLNAAPGFYGATGTVTPQAPLFAAEEPNFRGSLGIGFDIHKKGSTPDGSVDVSNNHLSIHFDGVEKQQFDLAGVLDLAGGMWIHAHLILRPGAGLHDVTVILTPHGGSPVRVVDRFRIDGFNPYEARLYFAGRSGGRAPTTISTTWPRSSRARFARRSR